MANGAELMRQGLVERGEKESVIDNGAVIILFCVYTRGETKKTYLSPSYNIIIDVDREGEG